MIVKWLNIAIAAVAGLVGAGYTYFWPGAKHDNKIEQAAEKVIEKRTGIEVDITPMDPNPKTLEDVKIQDVTDSVTTHPCSVDKDPNLDNN
jgi:ABC-type glycerol-3-phosphate transport system substrate-binding protein